MPSTARFYIFTGKGGVGKTTLSLSFCSYLKQQNKKCLYTYIESSKIDGDRNDKKDPAHLPSKWAKQLGIEVLNLNLMDCSRHYISKKLKSKTVAHWIVKTPFFQSLINMIPGFSYVIYMGQILELMLNDPELIIVLDSPSSGHALTMLESTKNFNQIFESGTIFEDTKLMLKTLQQEHFSKINIVTLPSLLAIHEATELQASIHKLFDYKMGIYPNNCLNTYQDEDLPEFLKLKIANEEAALSEKNEFIQKQISYSTAHTSQDVIKDLLPSMESLV